MSNKLEVALEIAVSTIEVQVRQLADLESQLSTCKEQNDKLVNALADSEILFHAQGKKLAEKDKEIESYKRIIQDEFDKREALDKECERLRGALLDIATRSPMLSSFVEARSMARQALNKEVE